MQLCEAVITNERGHIKVTPVADITDVDLWTYFKEKLDDAYEDDGAVSMKELMKIDEFRNLMKRVNERDPELLSQIAVAHIGRRLDLNDVSVIRAHLSVVA